MSKEESLKKVELKVHVNCCDGCKKKVLKALNIKGVLKTEIHPTLPRVTITGTVDVGVLIKKLSKVGKASELLQTENSTLQSTHKELRKIENNSEKKNEIIVPQVSYFVNHDAAPARMSLPESFGVPVPCYSTVAGPCYTRQQCCNHGVISVPAAYQNCPPANLPVSSPERARIADYFNDENTMGCYLM